MDRQKTVLIVEDEKNIVDILRFNLQREGYQTLEAYDGEDGLNKARSEKPDLILLDVMLPRMNGFEVCRTLRDGGDTVPILMLTAREEESDKVKGLELGADDYITKPFSMRELLARVKSNIRRTDMLSQAAPRSSANRLDLGRVQVDTDTMIVYKDGEALDLTQREYELLKFMAATPEKGLLPGGPHGACVELRRLRGGRAGGGRGHPPPAGKAGGRPRRPQVYHHPPGFGVRFWQERRAVVSCADDPPMGPCKAALWLCRERRSKEAHAISLKAETKWSGLRFNENRASRTGEA